MSCVMVKVHQEPSYCLSTAIQRTSCMKAVISSLTLALVATMPCASHAKDVKLTPQFTSCMEESGDTTQGMVECIGAETQRQDARLNKAYKALAVKLSVERQKQLQGAQRAWIRFRDGNCNFYYDPDGGSLARVNANECMMTMTAHRAKELENLAQ